MSTSRVQTWVLSTLAVTTILHLAAGVAIAAAFIDESRVAARVGLLLIAGAFGMLAVGGGFAIHRKSLLSWWLLAGWIPALAGAWLTFRR